MSWRYKLLDPMNMCPCKILLLSYIEKYSGYYIRYYAYKWRGWNVYF